MGLALLAIAGCAPSESGDAGNASTARQAFADVAAEAGLSRQAPPARAMEHILESTGSGVAVGDFDGDGDDDLYFLQQPALADYLAGRPGRANELYRNNGDGTFTEVGEQAGVALRAWGNAAYFADYDNDGDQDLFVANWGSNHFFWNNGDGTFTDATESAGLAGPSDGWSSAAAFGDLDQDGFLDLFVVNYCSYDPKDPVPPSIHPVWRGLDVFLGPIGLPGQADLLYRNHGDGTFTDISERAGLATRPKLYGLGVILLDLDRDLDLDPYVANDSVVNQLWRNDGNMSLVEIGAMSGTGTNENAEEQAGMGVDAADYDDDGFIDLFVTNFALEWNTLYVSEGGMRFRDATFEAGLSGSWKYMGWGTKFFDFDHDGQLDLAIANGHIYPQVDEYPQPGWSYRQPNQLLRNVGNGRFDPVADDAWNEERNSRGLALIDYDMDGDLDVVLTHIDAPPSLLRNDVGNQRNWVSIRLEGTNSNRDGIGARIELEIGDRTLTRIVNPYGSFQSQSTTAVHFGLGDAEYIDKLTVYWPSTRTFEHKDIQANRFYTMREGSGIAAVHEPSKLAP
jgi:hypothetical protein